MGIDLINPLLAIPRGVAPDWSRVGAWIDNLERAALWGTGDELFPLECWSEEAGLQLGLDEPVEDFMPAARADLRHYASVLRAAIERPDESGVLAVDLPDHRVYMSAAVDGDDGPGELVDSFIYTAECGAARAAGFVRWSGFCPIPLAERGLELDPAGVLLPPGQPVDAAAEVPEADAVADWIAWLAVKSFDFAAAQRAVDSADAPAELADALQHLRGRLAGEFSRMVIDQRVGDLRIWTAADYMGGAPTVAAIRTLGEAGVLDAAGVVGWDAPAPLS